MTLPAILLISLGVTCLLIGGLVLWHGRGPFGHQSDQDSAKVSFPSRVAIGMIFLISGYHFIIWAFPASLTQLQWPRSRWYVLPPAAVAAVLLSLWIDRVEGKPGE